MYNDGQWHVIANGGDVVDESKHSVSKNSLGLYYRLHILNVGVSDVKKYRCYGYVNGMDQYFYLKLDILGRCIKS